MSDDTASAPASTQGRGNPEDWFRHEYEEAKRASEETVDDFKARSGFSPGNLYGAELWLHYRALWRSANSGAWFPNIIGEP